jgi:hypothetical protein
MDEEEVFAVWILIRALRGGAMVTCQSRAVVKNRPKPIAVPTSRLHIPARRNTIAEVPHWTAALVDSS